MKSQRVHLSQTALSCLVAAAVASSFATRAPAATFRHPELGYTVWYPDGWTVHSPPELIEPVAASMDVLRALGVSVLVQKRTAKERPGLFVASSCGPKAYLGDGKILPEDHTELAVWRQATDTSCGDLLREQIYEHLALETFFDEKTVVAAGKEVQVYWFYAKPYWQWPVMYMLACKELGQSRFVLRFAVAGPGVDVGQLLQDMGRVYDSLQFPRGKP